MTVVKDTICEVVPRVATGLDTMTQMQELSSQFNKDNYLNQNPSINEVTAESHLTDILNIGRDEEVWMLQCPKTIDIDALINRKIKLPGKAHHEHLESVADQYPSKDVVTVAVNTKHGYKLRNIPISGMVVLRERHKDVDTLTENTEQAGAKVSKIKLPQGFKARHPLLGADYEEIIQINPAVAARLKEAREASHLAKKAAKTHKKKRHAGSGATTVEREVKQEPGVLSDISPTKVKKEKKRKLIDSETEPDQPRNKKIKIERDNTNSDLQWIKQL